MTRPITHLLWCQTLSILKVSLALGALAAVTFSIAYWFDPWHNFPKVWEYLLVPVALVAPPACWLSLRNPEIRDWLHTPGRKLLLLAGTSLLLYEVLFWTLYLTHG